MQTTTPAFLLDKKKKKNEGVSGLMSMTPVQPAAKMKTSSGPGSYKGTAINPGSDADIAAQIARIDQGAQASQAAAPTMTGAPAPVRGLFPNPQASLPATPYGAIVGGLVGQSLPTQQNSDIVSGLQNIGTDGKLPSAIADLQKLRETFAEKMAANSLNPIPLEFQQGRGQVLSNLFAQKEAALQQGLGNILEGQGQQINALGTAGNLSNTARQLGITGLTSAAGFAQPSPASYGQTVFDPITGTFTGGAGGNLGPEMEQALRQYAQLYATGQQSAIPSEITSNPILNARLLQYAQEANPNFNVNQAAGLQAGQQGLASQVTQLQAVETAAKGIESTIKAYLSANPQLNPSTLVAGNMVQQWLQGKQLADPRYQTLFNYINEYISTLAPILGVGGDTTNLKTEIAQSFINAQASGESISQVLDSISRLASDKVKNLQSGAFGGGVVTGSGGAGSITTQAADGNTYGFYQDANGVWHAQ